MFHTHVSLHWTGYGRTCDVACPWLKVKLSHFTLIEDRAMTFPFIKVSETGIIKYGTPMPVDLKQQVKYLCSRNG
jgi:hypothetical protein